jgi:hypothetical protein
MRKGFIFSIDAMLSVLVLIALMVPIMYFSSSASSTNLPMLDLERKGSDTLIVLDKTGVIDSKNSTAIEQAINQMLTSNLSWSLTAEYYNYTGTTFTLNQTLTFGQNDSNATNEAAAYRMFVVRNDTTGRIDNYGRAILKVWVQ